MASESLLLGEAIPSEPREALRVVSAVLNKINDFELLAGIVGTSAARKRVFPDLAVSWDDEPFRQRLSVVKPALKRELEFVKAKLMEVIK